MLDLSNTSERLRANVSTTLPPSVGSGLSLTLSPISAYQAEGSAATLSPSANMSLPDTQPLKSSKTSEADSILNEKVFVPYWNGQYQDIVSDLWLPTVTALQGLDTNSLSGLLTKPVANSWFSTRLFEAPKTNLPKTSCISFTSSPAACTEGASTVLRTQQIRLYPTAPQRALLRNWFGVSRKTHNQTVEYLKQQGTKANFMEIKKWLVPSLPEWARETPRAIKDGAVAQACEAVKNAKRKFKATGKFHEVGFRSRREPTQTLFIRNDMIRNGTIYPTKMGRLRMAESLPSDPRDSQLIRENGRYYLCVPSRVMVQRGDNQARIVGLDPGVRTFMSFYSPDSAGKLGEYSFGRIARLCRHLDALMSRIDTSKNARQRVRMRKAGNRLRWKIKDLVKEAHFKIGRFLVDNFGVILLPELETARLASRTKRKLRKKSVRAMLTWSHYRFQQRIKAMAEVAGVKVLPVDESYTSKTVNWTGEVNHRLGGAKFVRSSCGQTMDRDLNGALGVYLKGIVGYHLGPVSPCIC